MRYLNYLFSRLDENGLLEIGIGDWCQPHHMDGLFDTPRIVTNTADAYLIAEKAKFIFGELGMEPQKSFAEALSQKLRSSFREKLIDKNTLAVMGETQTAQAVALNYGLFDKSEEKKAFEVLMGIIKKDSGFLNVGVIGARSLFRVLCDFGESDLAFNMVTRPEFPSFGEWVSRGYTALPEAFFPEGGHLVSLNHHFWGDISAWFYSYIAGLRINPTGSHTANIDIKPYFIEKLRTVSAFYEAPDGKIEVSWSRDNGNIVITVNADEKLYGSVILPEGYRFKNGTNEEKMKTGKYTVYKI